MPKKVHDEVNAMLKSKTFYPDRTPEERKSIAWAIAQKHNKTKKQSFIVSDEMTRQLMLAPELEPGFNVVTLKLQDGTKIHGVQVYNCREFVLPEGVSIKLLEPGTAFGIEAI